jgi:probable rRNA maturation factor
LVTIHKPIAGLSELALTRFLTRARGATGLRGSVNVLVTSNAEMKSLNRRFRGKDQATDVLSFPAASDADKTFAGDIAISAEIARQNARSLKHDPGVEVKILALHGILHLCGYDHERDRGRMARREQKLRRELKLPVGLIERAAPGHASQQKRRRA